MEVFHTPSLRRYDPVQVQRVRIAASQPIQAPRGMGKHSATNAGRKGGQAALVVSPSSPAVKAIFEAA
jgi:hypothetical protein